MLKKAIFPKVKKDQLIRNQLVFFMESIPDFASI